MGIKNNIQKLLFFLLLGLLFLPFFQERLKVLPITPLSGFFVKTEKVDLSVPNFIEGTFQENFEVRRKENVGFHDFLIRLNNQRKYSLFSEVNTNDLIEGKNGMWFGFSYIAAHFGNDYMGYEKLKEYSDKIKFIQDSLSKRGKLFFPMIIPGKTSIYPELIPDRFYTENDKKTTNYESLVQLLDESETTYLDFRKFIVENKSQFNYPIFPKNGIHWTGNTVAIATDSLLDFIATETGKEIIDMRLSAGEVTTKKYRFTDYDIGESMNLFTHISGDSLHYPKVEYVCDNCEKPRVLGVGDSFLQSFRGFYHSYDSAFHPNSYLWYYNKTVDWPEKFNGKNVLIEYLDLEVEIEKSDIIILESTDENIRQLGFNFVDQLYDLLKNGRKKYSNNELSQFEKFKTDSTIEHAKSIIPLTEYQLEKQIQLIAISKHKASKVFNFETEVALMMDDIRNNSEWLELVKQQALERNITLEENIYLNAKWMVENEN
jgi:hypothetical protein